MKRVFHPYYLLGLAAVSFAMLFLSKINKTSFYHHYFKVIEEVETRNSQEIEVAMYSLLPEVRRIPSVAQSLIWVLFGLTGSLLWIAPIRFLPHQRPVLPILATHAPYQLFPPIRAP